MKKICSMGLLIVILLSQLNITAFAISPTDIVSEAAVLMDADTGQVLYQRNMNAKMYPASTTKIMTALLVAEYATLDDVAIVSKTALEIDEWNSSNIGLAVGEKFRVNDGLYALMLRSANDAANVLAEHVSGSQEEFAALMTARAWDMGAANTNFTNAHGLHEDDHYTTAYDMALITRYAAENPVFMQYFTADAHIMPPTNLQPIERSLINYCYMLAPDSEFYNPSVIGGKVGYTEEAQQTMSTIASRNGRTLICVVMNSPDRADKFNDTEALLAFGFNEFEKITIPRDEFRVEGVPINQDGALSGEVDFAADEDFTFLLHRDYSPEDVEIAYALPEAFEADDLLPSSVAVTLPAVEDRSEGLVPLLGTQPIGSEIALSASSSLLSLWDQQQPEDSFKTWISGLFASRQVHVVVIAILCAVLLVLALMLFLRYRAIEKRRRQRLERLNQRLRRGSVSS